MQGFNVNQGRLNKVDRELLQPRSHRIKRFHFSSSSDKKTRDFSDSVQEALGAGMETLGHTSSPSSLNP